MKINTITIKSETNTVIYNKEKINLIRISHVYLNNPNFVQVFISTHNEYWSHPLAKDDAEELIALYPSEDSLYFEEKIK